MRYRIKVHILFKTSKYSLRRLGSLFKPLKRKLKLNCVGKQQDRALWKAQAAWEGYRRLHAEYCSRINDPSPGSMAPMIYNEEFETITSARVKQVRLYLNREEGDF
jgi:uncharacterized protein YecT (DUF1311 family)